MATNDKQYKQIATTFVDSWCSGLDADMATFLAQFSRGVRWYDHAFFMQHRGHEGIAEFRTGWLTAIKDFGTDITAVDVIFGKGKVEIMIRCVYHGTMVGKLPGRRASGKYFRTNVILVLRIDDEGKIERVDEYCTATLDEGCEIMDYRLAGAKSRAEAKL